MRAAEDPDYLSSTLRRLLPHVHVVDDVTHVHLPKVKGMPRRLGQEVECARHFLDEHESRQSTAGSFRNLADSPALVNPCRCLCWKYCNNRTIDKLDFGCPVSQIAVIRPDHRCALEAGRRADGPGFISNVAIDIPADDGGGELDSAGQDDRGNPLGGLTFSNAFQSNTTANANLTQVRLPEWPTLKFRSHTGLPSSVRTNSA